MKIRKLIPSVAVVVLFAAGTTAFNPIKSSEAGEFFTSSDNVAFSNTYCCKAKQGHICEYEGVRMYDAELVTCGLIQQNK